MWDNGYTKKDLVKQIDDVLSDKDATKRLPSYIANSVDAIRNYGNFSAHRINDVTTLQILDVEEGETDWCLDVTEQVLEHYYERPAIEKARIAALNAKLKKAGKPETKQ